MINFIEKQGLSADAEKESGNLFAQLFLILPHRIMKQVSIQKLLDDLRFVPSIL